MANGMVKKVHQQGRSRFGAQSVPSVLEHGKMARTPLMAFFNISIILLGFVINSQALGIDSAMALKTKPTIHLEHILNNIVSLSHPKFQGRQAGTTGGGNSAQFIAERFEALGLAPVNQGINQQSIQQWLQVTPLTATQLLAPAQINFFSNNNPSKKASTPLQIGKDYLPILDSPAVNLTAPVVFVGYGISDPARGIDEYQDVDVRNRMVLFLRGKPPTYSQWITHEEKVRMAQEKGAAAFLTVTGPLLSRYEARKGLGQIPLAIYSFTPENRPIPGAWLSGRSLDQQLAITRESLEALQRQANKNPGQSSRSLPLLAQLSWETSQKPGALINVLGLVLGEDPILRKEVILIGAHRDHFGKQAGLLFPGSDDNASGTALMLEIARHFKEGAKKPKRSILFVSFDGEERGLLGSKHYIQHPAWPLKKTVAMVNLDHVGVGNGALTVGVTRIDKSTAKQAAAHVGLAEKIKVYGYFPGGDHVPFYEAEIPTITVVSAGIHPHFHQPTDTPDTINPDILKTATSFVLSLLDLLVNPTDN